MGTVEVSAATRNGARRSKAELTLLICGVTQPDAVMSALYTAEQLFADRLTADGIDLAENGTRVVSEPFQAGTDVAIYADLGDAPGPIVDRWVDLIAELAAVDPAVTDVRLPRRRSRIAALFLDTPMYAMAPASWTGRAPTSWLIAAAGWLADAPATQFVAYLNGVEFDVQQGQLAEQLAAGLSMTAGSFALVAFDGRTFVRVVHAGGGQLVWSRRSPPVVDDVGWASATDELTLAALSLRPGPAWACMFADLQYVPVLPALQPALPMRVSVHDCLLDPRWGLPDAYPVVLLPSDWAAAGGPDQPGSRPAGHLSLVVVADPRAFIPHVPRSAADDAVLRSARDRLAPIIASELREPPPTAAEITRGFGRLSWRHRRYGAPSARRIAGWLAESGHRVSPRDRGGVNGGKAELDAVESCVDAWSADPTKEMVAEEIGVFLGEVLFASVPESRWRVRANGEPVIDLQDGQEIDLFVLARERVRRGAPPLPAVLTNIGAR